MMLLLKHAELVKCDITKMFKNIKKTHGKLSYYALDFL